MPEQARVRVAEVRQAEAPVQVQAGEREAEVRQAEAQVPVRVPVRVPAGERQAMSFSLWKVFRVREG